MNIDDPKLTAFALNELDEPEKSTIAKQIAESPEAQRAVDETREMARLLKTEFAAEIKVRSARRADQVPRSNLSDIRDDQWFWSIGRPVTIAAVVAVFALIGAILIGTYSRQESPTSVVADYEIQAEQNSSNERVGLPTFESVPNPIPADSVQRIDHVVIGEISGDSRVENGELRPIERITDAYRIARLKQQLSVPAISRNTSAHVLGHCYGLIFLDSNGRIVASTRFCRSPNSEFLLEPVKNAYERGGRYFIGGSGTLPGEWRNEVDYNQYAIQFADWLQAIGYAPGA